MNCTCYECNRHGCPCTATNENLVPDYPDADGTDNAHPAWWRGCDDGTQMTAEWVNQVLDDVQNGIEPVGTSSSKSLNMLRDRLYNEFRRK